MVRPDDDIVARLERYREEQRAVRAARRAERQRADADAPGGAVPGVGGATRPAPEAGAANGGARDGAQALIGEGVDHGLEHARANCHQGSCGMSESLRR